jgi:hypothetical protein
MVPSVEAKYTTPLSTAGEALTILFTGKVHSSDSGDAEYAGKVPRPPRTCR